jgi:hypothetical protein
VFRERVGREVQFIWEQGVLCLPGSMNNKREICFVSAWTGIHMNPRLTGYLSQANIVPRTVAKGDHIQYLVFLRIQIEFRCRRHK